jgi:6-phosphogluconolactonase (cycloisomerase 2 family)
MNRKRSLGLLLGLLAALAVAASAGAAKSDEIKGAVYTLSNSPAGNAVLAFPRAADGSLGTAVPYATGGTGTGGGLGSQGALFLSDNGHDLFAVNAGSNSVSYFTVGKGGLELESTVPSGGAMPISVTARGKLVYVLNAGGAGNISGFTVEHDALVPIAGSPRPLGAGSAGPAQISFSKDGGALVVTEKASSTIDTYAVNNDGTADAPATFRAAGATPFGFDWDNHGNLLTSDASGSASSYSVSHEGRVNVISGAVPTFQAAPCWLVASKDGKFAWTANGGAGTITGFSVGHDGSLALLPFAPTSTGGAATHPLDVAMTKDGGLLYNLTDGAHTISAFRVGKDGSLTSAGTTAGLPVGAAGIVAS